MEHTVRQKDIVAHARKIIMSKGMEKLTIRELAREIRLTEGAIYKHFRSKREIIELLIEDIETTLLKTIDAALESEGKSLEKLKNVFASHLSYVEQRKGVSFAIINETINIKDEKLQSRMLSVLNAYYKRIERLLLQGMETGEIRKDIKTSSASVAFFGMVQSLVTLWALKDYDAKVIKTHMEEMFEIYIKGMVPSGRSRQENHLKLAGARGH